MMIKHKLIDFKYKIISYKTKLNNINLILMQKKVYKVEKVNSINKRKITSRTGFKMSLSKLVFKIYL
jgi:hypothetical protein